jgi:sugar-specific transcriptional regulator TrmB
MASCSDEMIWNVHGFENITKQLISLIHGAEKTIRIIGHPHIFPADVRDALERRADTVDTEIITSLWAGEETGRVRRSVRKHLDIPKETGRSKDMIGGGVCIIDGRSVMVIVGSEDAEMAALFSESEGFVRFFSRYYTLMSELAGKTQV